MDLLELKIIAFGHISGQQNLTKVEKIQLLDFVKESSEIQVLDLLATGRMKTEKECLKDDQKSLKIIKEQLEIQLEDIASDTKEYWAKKAGEAGAAGKAMAKQAKDYAVDKSGVPQKIEAGAKKGGTDILGIQAKKREELAQNALAKAKERAASRPKSTVDQVTDTISKTASQASQWAQANPGQAAATAALGAAAITAGVLAYKRFFSKAARACKDKSGAEKTSCMKSYKAQGKQAEIGVLMAKLNSCKGNPKCVNKIKARISAAKQDIQNLKSKK